MAKTMLMAKPALLGLSPFSAGFLITGFIFTAVSFFTTPPLAHTVKLFHAVE